MLRFEYVHDSSKPSGFGALGAGLTSTLLSIRAELDPAPHSLFTPAAERLHAYPLVQRSSRPSMEHLQECRAIEWPERTLICASGLPGMAHSAPIIFVVDDDISVRDSLELLIRSEGWQVEVFASAAEFFHRERPVGPSCLVLDVSMPGLSGLELQRRIAAERMEMPIIFITGYGDVPTTVRAMKAGAIEFLTKPFDDEVLLTAIRQAIERSQAAVDIQNETHKLRVAYESLSPREREVMALVVTGLLNKQIGAELGISEVTVKAHRGSLMKKMKAASLPDLVNMAAGLGLPGRSS